MGYEKAGKEARGLEEKARQVDELLSAPVPPTIAMACRHVGIQYRTYYNYRRKRELKMAPGPEHHEAGASTIGEYHHTCSRSQPQDTPIDGAA